VAVESDRAALAIARSNIEMARSLSQAEEVTIVDSDVESFASRFSNPFDVIFMDPPYLYPDEEVQRLLKQLLNSGAIVKETLIVLERASRTDSFPWPEGMHQVKVRKYGNAAIFYGELGNG
jgi:16S rRNA (guanine966-N2)-methyltransferase